MSTLEQLRKELSEIERSAKEHGAKIRCRQRFDLTVDMVRRFVALAIVILAITNFQTGSRDEVVIDSLLMVASLLALILTLGNVIFSLNSDHHRNLKMWTMFKLRSYEVEDIIQGIECGDIKEDDVDIKTVIGACGYARTKLLAK